MRFKSKSALGALIMALALSGLTAASALAAGAPTAETKPATAITETTAFLNGVVNANEAETKVYFEYGPTTSYGSKTTERTFTTKGATGATAKGLVVNKTYHFRLVATNSYGTSYGADEVFSTPVEPEAVVPVGAKITELKVAARSGEMYLEWDGNRSVACTGSEFSGHFINSRELEGSMKWSGCSTESHGGCTKGGEGPIQSEPLTGTLGYVNRAKKEVGLRLAGKSSETWAANVDCFTAKWPLTGSLGGTLELPVNTKIPAERAFSIGYKAEKGKQLTGELGGQLLWEDGYTDFGVNAGLTGSANKEFEIKA